MGRYLCLEPVLPVAMRFHASRSAVTSALASPMVEGVMSKNVTQVHLVVISMRNIEHYRRYSYCSDNKIAAI